MGFGEAIQTCLRKYVTFGGRARRSEYWYFYLFNILIGIAAGILDGILTSTTGHSFQGSGPITGLAQLALFLPSLAAMVRRLHDTNHSGWLVLGFFAYLIVAIIVLVIGFTNLQTGAGGPMVVLAFVMLLGIFGFAIYLLVLLCLNGTPGDNAYGSDPKGPNADVFS